MERRPAAPFVKLLAKGQHRRPWRPSLLFRSSVPHSSATNRPRRKLAGELLRLSPLHPQSSSRRWVRCWCTLTGRGSSLFGFSHIHHIVRDLKPGETQSVYTTTLPKGSNVLWTSKWK